MKMVKQIICQKYSILNNNRLFYQLVWTSSIPIDLILLLDIRLQLGLVYSLQTAPSLKNILFTIK